MKHIKNAFVVKLIIVLGIVSIFNISCSPDMIPTGCSNIIFAEDVNLDPDEIEDSLNAIRTVQNIHGFTTFDDQYHYFVENTSNSNHNVSILLEETARYDNLGFDGYLDYMVGINRISQELKESLFFLKSEMSSFFDTQPVLEEFKTFIEEQRTTIANSALCGNDKNSANYYLNLAQGYGQYFYNHY